MAEHQYGGSRDEIDEAVRAMFEHDGRTVTGWALVIASNRIDPDAPAGYELLASSAGYAVGPGMHPATALGLAEGLASHLRRIVRAEIVDEE